MRRSSGRVKLPCFPDSLSKSPGLGPENQVGDPVVTTFLLPVASYLGYTYVEEHRACLPTILCKEEEGRRRWFKWLGFEETEDESKVKS